jgi:5-oxoprolinase (ATP-hydrolysing)
MGHVQDNAEESVRRYISALKDCEFAYEMDQGTVIRVRITVDRARRSARVDFAGTSPEQPTNFNAPRPITRAAVLYVFRCMVDDAIPMNAGCLKPIDIAIPEDCMLAPRYPAAVVAGNVETSQAVTDTLFGALQAMAASQGTMNNTNFGNERHQYYETICGGSGAGPSFEGTSAVHTHDQHAPHRSRGARIPLSRDPRRVRHPPGLGRARPLAGRRWGNAGDPLPRAGGSIVSPWPSPRSALWNGGW